MSFFACCSGASEEPVRQEVVSEQKVSGGESFEGDKDGGNVDGSVAAPVSVAPAPISSAGGGEDQKETAKHRLQRLIRDFAHDAVGVGIAVEAMCSELGENDKPVSATLRMDRRLSQVEIWQAASGGTGDAASSALLVIKLQEVESIVKGFGSDGIEQKKTELDATPKDEAVLKMARKSSPELKLTFESSISRDRAYTCLRIFQMSVDQSGSGSASPQSPPASPREG